MEEKNNINNQEREIIKNFPFTNLMEVSSINTFNKESFLKLNNENEIIKLIEENKKNENTKEKIEFLANLFITINISFIEETLISSENLQKFEDSLRKMLKKGFLCIESCHYTSPQDKENEGCNVYEKSKESVERYNRIKLIRSLILKEVMDMDLDLRSLLENDTEKNKENLLLILQLEDQTNIPIQIQKTTFLATFLNNGRLDLFFKFNFFNSLIQGFSKASDKEITSSEFPVINSMKNISDYIEKTLKTALTVRFHEKEYKDMVGVFTREKFLSDQIEDLFKLINLFLNFSDKKSIEHLEKLIIQILGHWDSDVGEEAVVMLNMIYDNNNFQENYPLETELKRTDEEIAVEVKITIESNPQNQPSLDEKIQDTMNSTFCYINIPEKNGIYSLNYTTPNKIKIFKSKNNKEKEKAELILKFVLSENAEVCGYYDYNIIQFNKKNGTFGCPLGLSKILGDNNNDNYVSLKKSFDNNEFNDRIRKQSSNIKHKQSFNSANNCKDDEEEEIHYESNKGRFVVVNKSIDDLSIHEVFTDLEKENKGENQEENEISNYNKHKRSDFKTLKSKLPHYKQKHINCLYIMGTLERDNLITFAKTSDKSLRIMTKVDNPEASPMAITCRKTISNLLGGDNEFKDLVSVSKNLDMKIVIDCLTRISSSRSHKRYKDLFLQKLDEKGKLNFVYGSDGHSVSYEDTAILNYRLKESWDLMVEDLIELIGKYGIDGVHMDSSQSWPHMNEINVNEMFRKDVDGTDAYTEEDILSGRIVMPNEEAGFWTLERSDNYPNPFLTKITKKVWEKNPQFIFIGECWSREKFKLRHIALLRSGIIPRMYTLPRAISLVIGRKLHRNGYIENCIPENVSIIKKFYEENYNYCPRGSRIIQSSSGQVWPYPSLLYSRGNWAAVDLLFTLMDIPMTFMDEIYGEAFRVQITSVYAKTALPNVEKTFKSAASRNNIRSRKGSTDVKGNEDEKSSGKKIGRLPSQMRITTKTMVDSNDPNYYGDSNNMGVNSYASKIPQISSRHSVLNMDKDKLEEVISTTGNIGTFNSLSGVSKEQTHEIRYKQEEIIRQVGPEFGFDLSKIKYHYDHRRKLRNEHECLRKGELIYLKTYDKENNPHPAVIAFARRLVINEEKNNDKNSNNVKKRSETGIIIINLSFNISYFKIDFEEILKGIEINNKTVCFVQNWQTEGDKGEYKLLSEILAGNDMKMLNPFKSQFFSFQVMEPSETLFKETLESSTSSLICILNSQQEKFKLDNYYISLKLKNILEINNLEKFSQWFMYFLITCKTYSIDNFENFFSKLNFLIENESNSNTFVKALHIINNALTEIVNTKKDKLNEKENSNEKSNENISSLKSKIEIILNKNKLGKIVFVTPELGRWSTVGGLGVMVDELSQGLVAEGKEVIMIAPYYDKNRKGESDYLKKDAAKWEYIGNITIHLDDYYTFGIHYSVVNGVKIYFLHNAMIFPCPYPDATPDFVTRQIACFCKASLELMCFIKICPEIIMTNDWFTGMTAAYSKYGHFGDYFKNSKFFHICHNLEPSYEGRLYPDYGTTLEHIYKLPADLLIDPYWEKKVLNPSRCAIICSDQWGTVSNSYKADLIVKSPLEKLLNQHPKPFAFPNGIFREKRIKVLQEKVAVNHTEAKKKIQQKYFKIEEFDDSIPMFSFVGRITEQKGVILICQTAEMIINKTGGKINILVGGMGNIKDPYVAKCVEMINYLRSKYPQSFWADPTEFFTDGPFINIGSDFGLMPSVFEPGGIVQHEFFIGSTPVLAFKTGGLKDTVLEYDYNNPEYGNGITFDNHTTFDLLYAFERSIQLFNDKNSYMKARDNAFKSAIDVIDVARAWDKEFHRIQNKVYFNKENLSKDKLNEEQVDKLYSIIKNFDYGKFDFEDNEEESIGVSKKRSSFKTNLEENVKVSFTYSDIESRYKKISVIGSFNNWSEALSLSFNPIFESWSLITKLPKGEHHYKYIVDGEWVINKMQKITSDEKGNMNNFILI